MAKTKAIESYETAGSCHDDSQSPCDCSVRLKICIAKRFLDELTEECLDALMFQNYPPSISSIFQRNGVLVRLKNIDSKTEIDVIDKDILICMMARSAYFVNDKDVPTSPPKGAASDILSLPGWDFPTLSGVVSTPVLRKDGTVLTSPGYDEASGLFYRPSPGLYVPDIKEEPTKEDAVGAAQYLLTEVLGDFPYVDQASRANALAALITPLVRPVIDGCTPLFLFDKPTPGSGATLQTEIIANIVTGKAANLKKLPTNEEEIRKQITSWLLPGPQLIIIDNIDTEIRSAYLSSALTGPVWDDRILGHSKNVSLLILACWYATGNNIQLNQDIPRRACLIRIDVKMEKPWMRDTNQFRHPDIIEWIRVNRGEILANALTMARAWYVGGKPKGSAKPLGGYKNWTEILSGMLEYAGVTGLLENADKLAERDAGSDEWTHFLAKWYEIFGPKPILMKELLNELWRDEDLAEVMPEEVAGALRGAKTQGAGIKVGKVLVRKTGVTYSNSLRLIKGEDAHKGQKTWAVVKEERAGSEQVVGG
jgi:hypothetical protein